MLFLPIEDVAEDEIFSEVSDDMDDKQDNLDDSGGADEKPDC